jgi:signal peptidase II
VHALQTERRTALTLRRKYPIWGSVLLVAALVWATDFVSKNWAINYLDGKEPRPLIGNFLRLTFTKNSGAAFSFGTDRTILLVAFAIVVIGVIGYWTPRITSRKWGVVLGLVLGGTLGNLTDRIIRANVKTGVMKGQVNFADSSIVAAAVIASYLSLRNIVPVVKKGSDGDPDGA